MHAAAVRLWSRGALRAPVAALITGAAAGSAYATANARCDTASVATQLHAIRDSLTRIEARLGVVTAVSAPVNAARPDLCTSTRTDEFVACSYNILAESLGSNTIPWVMVVEPQLKKKVELATGMLWRDWVDATLSTMYKAHFHKNLDSGNYKAMRRLWSSDRLLCQSDLCEALRANVQVVNTDTLRYTHAKTGETRTVLTLRGALWEALPPALAQHLFEHIYDLEAEVFAWEKRGPRVFAAATKTHADGRTADIIGFQEFDCQNIVGCYRPGHGRETFHEAMGAKGYDGLIFQGTPPSKGGIGCYWKREKFEVDCDKSKIPPTVVLPRRARELVLGTQPAAVHNVDMEECWHDAKTMDGKSTIRTASRKNAAFLRLRNVQNRESAPLWVAVTHLMTTSRDNPLTNLYPGEVRAGELATIRSLVRRIGIGTTAREGFLLLGDFNTRADRLDVFSGRVAHRDGCEPMLAFDTGFDMASKTLDWMPGGSRLRESFAATHRWGDAPCPDAFSSFNSERKEWIDFIWYSEDTYELLCSYDNGSAKCRQSIPDQTHGSDHLPITARFALRREAVCK